MSEYRDMLKPTLLLAAVIFLMMAPAPDAQDISDMTEGFIVGEAHPSLLANDSIQTEANG